MKKIIFYLLSLLVFFSCEKDTANPYRIFQPGDMKTGKAESLRDGQKWTATAHAQGGKVDKSHFGIHLSTYGEDGSLREVFRLRAIPYKIGKIKLEVGKKISDNEGCWTSYLIYDDDIILTPIYYLTSKSCIEITKLDTTTNQIEGTFTKMTLEPEKKDSNFPRKVVFDKGTFNTTIDFK